MVVAGVDIGSQTSKAVVLKGDNVYRSALFPTGTDLYAVARKVVESAAQELGHTFDDIQRIVATGYGRVSVPFAADTMSEITCNAVGVYHFYPDTRVIVDIGGQDSKVIKLNSEGKVVNFAMNDKCAAGTGRFLEVAAETLGVSVAELAALSRRSKNRIRISSTCTVFAQTEIVSLIARRTPQEDIAAGLHESIVSRVYGLVNSIGPGDTGRVVMTGGVARNDAIVSLLANAMKREITVPEDPQIVTAFGAALVAKSRLGSE